MARLILRPGKADERVYELGDVASIGRTKQNDVFVLHKSLSRKHATLTRVGAKWLIEDLGSKNGTFVDGVRIERRELGAAHYVKCGDVLFSFVAEEGAGKSVAPMPAMPTMPTLVCDVTSDPARRTLQQLLTKPSARLGSQTALNLRAESGTERAREKLQILLKVSEMLSSPVGIDDVLATILDLAFQILNVDRASVLMADDSAGGAVVPRVSRTQDGGSREVHDNFSRQIVDYVMQSGQGALFADPRADPRLDGAQSILQQSICSSMCAPLKPRDDRPPFGALYVDNLERTHGFVEEDLEFLTAFANQAAVAVDNALLRDRLAGEAVTRKTLERFFPPTAMETIMGSGGSLEPIDTVATALFCDISGYTALSSHLPPRDVIGLLNGYFPVMSDIVFKHEGTLEKYIGDALLAVWGAPIRTPRDAMLAVSAAVDMQRAMRDFNRTWHADRVARGLDPGPELAIHIGINSGPVAAGNIGSSQFLQYATIGDATNVASRVCGVAQDGEIVIDADTHGRLDEGAFETEALPPTRVKGKSEPLRLFRVKW